MNTPESTAPQQEAALRDARAESCSLSPEPCSQSPDLEDPRVIAAVQEYLAALECGDKLSRSEFVQRHPDIAGALGVCLAGLEFVHQAASGLHASALKQPTAAPAEAEAIVGTPLGDFQILREIGRGGMGVVYEAEQLSLGRRVALKILPFAAALDPKHLQRFKNEAQAAAHLHHTNIVPVFGVGCERGVHYYAMQFIDGQTLAQVIAGLREVAGRGAAAGVSRSEGTSGRETPAVAEAATRPHPASTTLPSPSGPAFFRTVANLGMQAAEALEHAHQLGIVHRDIKPANLLVDVRGNLWITDFGLAHCQSQAGLTMTGDLVGTLRYMSPEQVLAKRLLIDHRTDIYSLGVTLYELLTLEPAFTGSDREELLQQIAFEEPPPPRQRNKAIPRELETIVLKAIDKSPEGRYAAAQELADDLGRFLEHKPIRATRPTLVQRASKWCRRNPLLAGALTAVVVTVVLGTVVACLLAAWALNENDRANEQTERARQAEAKANIEAEQARRESYAAKLHLMQPAWDSHDMLQLQGLMTETAAFPERGFEWYYWQRQCHVEHLMLVGHTGGVLAVAFAPDGQRLVTGGKDGTARIWDARSGQELFCLRDHRREVPAVAFAPDGQWLVTGSMDGTAKLWNVSHGRLLRTLHGRNTGSVWAVAVTPDGYHVLTGSEDGITQVWDAASGQELLTLDGHTALPDIAASTMGLLSSPQAQGALLAASAIYPGRTGHPGPVWAVAVTPDGKRLITTGQDNLVMVWDAVRGRLLRSWIGGDFVDWGINSVAVTPDGKRVITAGNDNSVRVWDVDTGTELLALRRHTGWISSAALTPDGKRVVLDSGAALLWDMVSRREILTFRGHTVGITCIAVSPDGQRLATAGLDATARVWNMAGGQRARTIKAHTQPVNSLTVTRDGQRIVTGSDDCTAKVWDAISGRELWKLEGHTYGVSAVAVTPDGQRIITGGGDGWIRIWDAVSGQQIRTLDWHTVGDPALVGIRSMAVTPDGQRLITTCVGAAQIWDVASGEKLMPLNVPADIVMSVAVTRDGQRAVTGTWNDATTRLWDINSVRELLDVREPTGLVSAVAVTPDSQRLITGRSDGVVTVSNAANGQKLFSLSGHTGMVRSIAVTSDGQRIITASADGTVRIWDAISSRELLILKADAGPVWSVAVTPDGQQLVAGCDDGTVRIWEAATAEQVARWAEQDQEVERRRAPWEKPSAKAPGFIQDWLVLGPVALAADQSVAKGLDYQQLPGEANLHPRGEDPVRVGNEDLTWHEHHCEEPVLDSDRLPKKQSGDSVAYLVCYPISAAERSDLLLQVGCNHPAKVYLNGQEVYTRTRVGGIPPLNPVGPVTLHKGANILILKVVTPGKYKSWISCARFVDREGDPIQDLPVRLTPE